MKFKVLKGTDLFAKLSDIKNQMLLADQEALELMNSIKLEGIVLEGYSRPSHGIAGGIRAFCCDRYLRKENLPSGWMLMERSLSKWIFPKSGDKNNKDLLERIKKLPIVSSNELKELLNYGNYAFAVHNGMGISTVPGVQWGDKYILLSTPDGIDYKPVKDMVEILVSEFDKLSKTIK